MLLFHSSIILLFFYFVFLLHCCSLSYHFLFSGAMLTKTTFMFYLLFQLAQNRKINEIWGQKCFSTQPFNRNWPLLSRNHRSEIPAQKSAAIHGWNLQTALSLLRNNTQNGGDIFFDRPRMSLPYTS